MRHFKNFFRKLISVAAMLALWIPVMAQTYIITESSGTFTATGGTLTSSSGAIQTVIDDIRADAAGANCTIQFGSGGADVLDIGTASVTFENIVGESWGTITLTGKITSSVSVFIRDGVSANSQADITNTAATNGAAIYKYGAGTLTITAGTMSVLNGGTASNVILNFNSGSNAGTINIDGGTVVAAGTSGRAVYNDGTGTVNIISGTVSAT